MTAGASFGRALVRAEHKDGFSGVGLSRGPALLHGEKRNKSYKQTFDFGCRFRKDMV